MPYLHSSQAYMYVFVLHSHVFTISCHQLLVSLVMSWPTLEAVIVESTQLCLSSPSTVTILLAVKSSQTVKSMLLWAFYHLSSSPQFSINTDLDCHHETCTNFMLCWSLSILQSWTVKTLQESNHLFITVHQFLSWLCIPVIILGQSSSFTSGIQYHKYTISNIPCMIGNWYTMEKTPSARYHPF